MVNKNKQTNSVFLPFSFFLTISSITTLLFFSFIQSSENQKKECRFCHKGPGKGRAKKDELVSCSECGSTGKCYFFLFLSFIIIKINLSAFFLGLWIYSWYIYHSINSFPILINTSCHSYFIISQQFI